MKRLLTITVLTFRTITGVASAATLKSVTLPPEPANGWASDPIFATAPPNDARVFVVERGDSGSHEAAIRIVKDGALQPEPFLTVPNVDLVSERGLLSMAFSPDYATSGLFYVFWIGAGADALDPTGTEGDIRIVEFRRSAGNPDLADPDSARLVLETNHSAGNHNGGWMAFGPDDNLYITIGDNADGSNAPLLTNLFGKVLRIDPADPAGPATYTIPADNPFVSNPSPSVRDEIYTYGLRNPFRASFTPDGRLTIADVGQSATEEVNVGGLAGRNMGWPTCEGFCDTPDPAFTEPFFSYEHPTAGNNSPETTGSFIIGGHVVRDPDLTGLTGRYIYGDGARANLRTLNLSVPGGDPVDPGVSVGSSLISFGEDSTGCSYLMSQGTVFRIAAGESATSDCPHVVKPPDPPDPPVDSTKPDLALDSKGQRLGRNISFFATCSEKCTVSGEGTLKAKRRGNKKALGFKYTAASRVAAANQKVKIVLSLKPKALRNARKLVRNGRKLTAALQVTAADPSGNQRSFRFTVKVRRTTPSR
ncbi:MAG: PQQ-dependent sugar dehydrogenase [Solirubrobacterales bacterium]